eukprot:scaffold36637_cov45-Prasinocladus_malaysianus.AAC.1
MRFSLLPKVAQCRPFEGTVSTQRVDGIVRGRGRESWRGDLGRCPRWARKDGTRRGGPAGRGSTRRPPTASRWPAAPRGGTPAPPAGACPGRTGRPRRRLRRLRMTAAGLAAAAGRR